MAETTRSSSSSLAANGSAAGHAAPHATKPRKRSLWGRATGFVGGRVWNVAVYALDKFLSQRREAAPDDAPAAPADGSESEVPGAASGSAANPRLRVLHSMAEQLRGAADSFLAAKLDEIEARVDTKLDDIESRIDEKIAEMHTHLAEMRDRELKHRLRILKVTLIFTVLVAALGLGYKWACQHWFH
jgi:hypothetical protein